MNLESMGEELRILYVAMTRAKEKLFITAGDRYLGRHVEKWGGISGRRELPFTFLKLPGPYLGLAFNASENARASLSVTHVPAAELLKEAARSSQAWKAGRTWSLSGSGRRGSLSSGGPGAALLPSTPMRRTSGSMPRCRFQS